MLALKVSLTPDGGVHQHWPLSRPSLYRAMTRRHRHQRLSLIEHGETISLTGAHSPALFRKPQRPDFVDGSVSAATAVGLRRSQTNFAGLTR